MSQRFEDPATDQTDEKGFCAKARFSAYSKRNITAP
jgi:hypothetical protein